MSVDRPLVDVSNVYAIDPHIERAFPGAGLQAVAEIRADVVQIAHWSGVGLLDVVKVLGCLDMWDFRSQPRCVICGCTDDQACDPPCSWVEDPKQLDRDVCSACVAVAAAPDENAHYRNAAEAGS